MSAAPHGQTNLGPPDDQPVEDTVLYEVTDGIALITLNRPAKLNALTLPMRNRFLQLVGRVNHDDDARVLVITGAGRGFCAGADRDYLRSIDGDGIRAATTDTSFALDALMRVDKPTICALNGAAAGIGLVYSLMTDIRFAADDAKFTTAFSKLGLVAEGGVSWLLPKLIGTARALDLLYTARTFTGTEALEMGLVQWVYPADRVLAAALDYARELASLPSYSLINMRRQVYEDWTRTWPDSFAAMRTLVAESVDREDFSGAMNESIASESKPTRQVEEG